MIRPVFSDAIRGTGIGQQSPNQTAFRLFPNPGNGDIQIATLGLHNLADYEVSVTNLMGSSIDFEQSNHGIQLLSAPNGIYFIRLQAKNASQCISLKYYKNEEANYITTGIACFTSGNKL